MTAKRLNGVGIHEVSDLKRRPAAELERLLGSEADRYLRLANGIDDRPVVADREAKSIGQEQTFGVDVVDPDAVRLVLFEQVEQVGRRVRKHGLFARGVSLKIRYGDFETITRSMTLENPTDSNSAFWSAAAALYDKWCQSGFKPVRLIGMAHRA